MVTWDDPLGRQYALRRRSRERAKVALATPGQTLASSDEDVAGVFRIKHPVIQLSQGALSCSPSFWTWPRTDRANAPQSRYEGMGIRWRIDQIMEPRNRTQRYISERCHVISLDQSWLSPDHLSTSRPSMAIGYGDDVIVIVFKATTPCHPIGRDVAGVRRHSG